ncbi:TolC family protein [Desulfopila sp. IMCC35006]|uniref:TolC family protein n=1 Tax=Desulfopila sp. IMCC35006 TaxID=2569542 RepID=UPI0010AD5725|nr:TolC family protein [Desulfopila sp. IMCC35006]TKB23704.1 TolC family protein [Desulfopila sp. IMCC35006]
MNWARFAAGITLLSIVALSGCARVEIDKSIDRINKDAADFTEGKLILAQNLDQRKALESMAAELLAKPLSQSDAVQLALVNSPALQAMLAANWSKLADAAQTGRITNPVFSFERLVLGDELELTRLLSFNLLDLLTLPQRYGLAQHRIEEAQLRLTIEVVDLISQIRLAWVNVLAAQQNRNYAEQVFEAAEVSSRLAREMQRVGNFSKLQRVRQQVFYSDAATHLARAEQETLSSREQLIRLLGLSASQAEELLLPKMLPTLPENPRTPQEISKAANQGRLDIKLAEAELQAAAKAQGLNQITSLTDIELGIRQEKRSTRNAGSSISGSGYDIGVQLPVFDWGDMLRAGMNADTLAAVNRLEATVSAAGSELRESYSEYRTAYDVSKHYRDEVLPLSRIISEENVLRYNGMLTGVFDLLAETREQIRTVMAAISAQKQFWLADAALHAAVIGHPKMLEQSL